MWWPLGTPCKTFTDRMVSSIALPPMTSSRPPNHPPVANAGGPYSGDEVDLRYRELSAPISYREIAGTYFEDTILRPQMGYLRADGIVEIR